MDETDLRDALIAMHDRIRTGVLAALESGAGRRGLDPATSEARVAAQGQGDVTFGIDEIAEREVERTAEEIGKRVPLQVVCEGFGFRRFGRGEPRWRLIVDPVDGTRNLMFDMRSGWALSALAPEKGDATRLADVRVAVQSELPTTDRRSAAVLTAIRGGGARILRKDLASGAVLEERALTAGSDDRIGNGFYVFFKFNPEEKVAIARVEEAFLRELAAAHGADRATLYDDQYISSAGQLYLLLTHRYRFLADLRGAIGDLLGVANQTSKPYDVCCALIAEEAGIPLLGLDGTTLDLPLDLEARTTLVAYANAGLRARLEPVFRRAWAAGTADLGATR